MARFATLPPFILIPGSSLGQVCTAPRESYVRGFSQMGVMRRGLLSSVRVVAVCGIGSCLNGADYAGFSQMGYDAPSQLLATGCCCIGDCACGVLRDGGSGIGRDSGAAGRFWGGWMVDFAVLGASGVAARVLSAVRNE